MRQRIVSGIMVTLLLASLLMLAFNIQPVRAIGTIYIRPDGSVDPSTAPIQRVGNLYTFTSNIIGSIIVQKDAITIDGKGCALQGDGTVDGFDLSNVGGVTVKNVHISNFWYGVYVDWSENDIWRGPMPTSHAVLHNIISDCKVGIYLFIFDHTWTAHGHRIVGNIIKDNIIGVGLDYTRCNYVYHNNFLNNTCQVVDYSHQPNYWYAGYPSGGNYWSDHASADDFKGVYQNETGSDGICDTPYGFEGGLDWYPLMNPFVPLFCDLNYDGKVDIKDISMVALAFGSYIGHPRWNPQADLKPDNKIDIRDIALIAKHFGKTYP